MHSRLQFQGGVDSLKHFHIAGEVFLMLGHKDGSPGSHNKCSPRLFDSNQENVHRYLIEYVPGVLLIFRVAGQGNVPE